ncbi:hypothetical protein [Planktothrix agardhii]|uniref:hypothetical protein n=1 Tax=Planktothrix agardhii TaxID=1160 RepID=UPI001D0A4ABC|nr:hypothetical protein [Planktothrix agardhii]MCB8788910.1 hypothetical protein [Planktothrix agardhii 1025]MCF3578345.1 hypothetical protein [Planktothrix agardhii 1812]MCF3614242.1 hypothetical protein [Planktothrix agardhii 1027]MCF3647829.1 hypothetical protein [Planktothrix agardhii 1026]
MKNTWILTTGSSDIQLNTEKRWDHFYTNAKSELSNFQVKPQEVDKPSTVENKSQKQYAVPSRVLAKVYGKDLKQHYDKLIFPLLDGFTKKLQDDEIKINRVIIILTDQDKIFPPNSQKRSKRSPYWQDTCENQSFYEEYFKRNDWFQDTELSFLTLKPELKPEQHQKGSDDEEGLDNWNSVLGLVETLIQTNISVESDEIIYLSHQAGTPAISSALQFISLSKFNQQVKFLVSNEYKPNAVDIIDSSNYLRKLQIEKAKKLIHDGLPGTALVLLEGLIPNESDSIKKLKEFVDIFNIKATVDNKEDEFKPKNAIERVRDALDLIEIFFKQENYLQGITLLMAAQETFLKAAIIHLVSQIPGKTGNIDFVDLLTWDETGLYFKSETTLLNLPAFNLNQNADLNLELSLCFPNPISDNDNKFFRRYLYQPNNRNGHNIFKLNNICNSQNNSNPSTFQYNLQNFRLFAWLQRLAKEKLNLENWEWKLLEWSCEYSRTHDLDLRNQYVHNLRGGEKKDILRYLIDPNNQTNIDENQNVQNVYNLNVKKPFINALHSLRLLDDNLEVNLIEQDLKDLANSL